MKQPLSFRYTFDAMRKNSFLLIIFINSMALLGLFFTQVYWVREAYGLIEDQFASSVRIAMKGVANQMLSYELKVLDKSIPSGMDSSEYNLPDVHNLNLNLLEFKINEEFRCMQVGNDYEFAVVDLWERSIITGKFDRYGNELIASPHQIILVGFRDPERYVLSAYFPGQHEMILKSLMNWIIVSVIFAVVLIIGFPVSLYIFNRQKKVSDMKSDFINNMTHEFKTPIATISLASEMLMKKAIQEDPARTQRYARIIFDENTRLQNHVEQILSVSLLDRGQFRLKKREIDIHEIISEVVENFGITVKERGGEINTHFCSNQFIIHADKEHLTNVIINLLDNANKYSPEKPWIRIGTQSTDNGIIISVEDRGVGINLENQQQIFKNLYRIPTGNLYNVKGFGIGLYYVKTIVEAHGGHINLKSEPNKGSRFDVYLPLVNKSSNDDEYNQTKNSPG
jgi:two-component system phosphate regulon sensor histidine kinase PhoR